MSELERRSYEFRAESVDAEQRTITGIGVPWNEDADIGDYYTENFERGSVEDDGAVLFYMHGEPIGTLVRAKDTDKGREITVHVSETNSGNDAYTLAKDGALRSFSIGFEPVEHRDAIDPANGHITRTRTKVIAREYSLVPFPAYVGATVGQVRSAETTNERPTMADNTDADLNELRESIDDLDRRMAAFKVAETPAPQIDKRSAGEVLKAIADGDKDTVERYIAQRAYTGGTSADTVVKDAWVGDLSRIFDDSSGVLARIFSTGTLPAKGLNVEFAEISTNTVDVDEQAAEGDDLASGNLVVTTRTAPIKTYGGTTQLTRQEIERASVNVLDKHLVALAMAAGKRKKIALRTAYDALVTAREGIAANAGVIVLGAVLGSSTAAQWEAAVVEAAIRYEALGLPLEALLVSKDVFLKMSTLTVSGERVFSTFDGNHSGELNLPGLKGQLAGLPVLLDSGEGSNSTANFVNSQALKAYDSALVNLSDENIVNLSKSFSVYRYGAVAAEIPGAIVPVKLAAS